MTKLAKPNPDLPLYKPQKDRGDVEPSWLDIMLDITQSHLVLIEMEESLVGGVPTKGRQESSQEDPSA